MMITIYATFKDQQEADNITKALLEKKIIACANSFPIRSAYLWKGRLEEDIEIACLMKTKNDNWEKVKEVILNLHSYDTPCIEKFDTQAVNIYENWVTEETK